MTQSFLVACQVLYVDHIAVTTPVFDQTLDDYLGLPGARLLKGPALNPAQKVRYAFVRLADGIVVEILGVESGSPIATHVQHGGGPYHFCYAVADIADAVACATDAGAKLLVAPVPDTAFDGRHVAFLFNRSQGLFEFVEAFPRLGDARVADRPLPAAVAAARLTVSAADDIPERLAIVLRRVFPALESTAVSKAGIGNAPGWDSLAQIRLVMEIESAFGVDVPSEIIPELTTYERILQMLRKERA